ncbi:MAG: hypothetical protein NVS1B4_23940 [Gemmatimonadaceae bacterium]
MAITACEYGPIAAGASVVVMVCRDTLLRGPGMQRAGRGDEIVGFTHPGDRSRGVNVDRGDGDSAIVGAV